ncbi:hypothetical protein PPSIR1_08731 [Plesiocystis pacifica SIR-1]|uniref:Uncharacterized protein n=2 Tax=Plesiocystis pacifica TaxID=191768 RepID=A6G7C3_9BACT|nr:hypothetical protein PPSIR1_08731 [Plesiocystis pacifica SIR-1]
MAKMRARAVGRPLVIGLVGLVSLAAPTRAQAAPVEASASVPHEPGATDGARDAAVDEARKLALEQALTTIREQVRVDEAAVAGILEHAQAWTAGYRILEVETAGQELRVRVEVEIDLPRLRKRVAVRSETVGGFRWGGASIEGCADVGEAQLSDPLRAYGIVADASPSSLTLELRCADQGQVSHTRVRAVSVTIAAKTEGDSSFEIAVDGRGFSNLAAEAQAAALDQAIAELADALAVEARGELELRVEQPWPAPRLRVLEGRLREAVIGVDRVELAGIAADGTAILRIAGGVELEGLGRQLQGLSFPGFGLVGLRVDSAHALRVRMQ